MGAGKFCYLMTKKMVFLSFHGLCQPDSRYTANILQELFKKKDASKAHYPLLGVYSRTTKPYDHTEVCTGTFTIALSQTRTEAGAQ